jgi:hypothetical protein
MKDEQARNHVMLSAAKHLDFQAGRTILPCAQDDTQHSGFG